MLTYIHYLKTKHVERKAKDIGKFNEALNV